MALSVHYVSHAYVCGYGIAAKRLVLALADAGVDIGWTPIVFDPVNPIVDTARPCDSDLAPLRGRVLDADVVVVHAVPEMIPALEHLRRPGAALVCHTVWEHEQLQPHWPDLLNRCDGVIVPTQWNADAFVAAGVRVPVAVVPHVIAPDVEPDPAWLGSSGVDVGARFVVHSIAAWNDRKQPWTTVEAFARAFGPDDDAVLVLKTDRHLDASVPSPPGPPDRRRLTSWTVASVLHRHHPTAEVCLVHDRLSDAEVAALHQRSDCWLSLPHAEGWDLGAFDATVAATPVITTGWGGPMAYLDPTSTLAVPGVDAPHPTLADTTWMNPDVDVAVDILRSLHACPTSAIAAAGRHAETVHRSHTPAAVAQRFLTAVGALATPHETA